MKILVTGSRGMLGTDLLEILSVHHEVFGCDLHNCDILDEAQVEGVTSSFRPDVIVHAAAYTNVDQAEIDREIALQVNETGTRHIAGAAKRHHARLMHISTDYVFDGTKTTPYTEEDPPCPLGIYGETKFRAEQQVRQILDDHAYVILRPAWLYGKHGKNFVSTILRLAHQHKTLRIVNDQTGSPTYTRDFARAILALLEKKASGIVHLTNTGHCTWYEFTKTILDFVGITGVVVQPITTEELGRPAPRPKFSVLDTSKFTHLTGQMIRHWKDGLQGYLDEM
jgi:dTDP-4-dehydrorhamnose reductase